MTIAWINRYSDEKFFALLN